MSDSNATTSRLTTLLTSLALAAIVLCGITVASTTAPTTAGIVLASLSGPAASIVTAPQQPVVVDLAINTHSSLQTILAVQVCAGLYNRRAQDDSKAPRVYTLLNHDDVNWLQDLVGLTLDTVTLTNASDFIVECLAGSTDGASPVAAGAIRYDYKVQQVVVPELVTVASSLEAVPLEDEDAVWKMFAASTKPSVVFDATADWKGYTERDATEYIYKHYVDSTTSMAMLNPGWGGSKPLAPKLVQAPKLGLVDFVVKEKLFSFFLYNACIPLTEDHSLMKTISAKNSWPRPIPVYGYNNAWNVAGGDLFESETNCVAEHNLGQIATDDVNNLSYLSLDDDITTPLKQSPETPVTYDAEKTYVSVVLGDGDNIAFMKGSRREWLNERTSQCKLQSDQQKCFPLLWTASPHLLRVAPSMARWYYDQAATTQADYFVLPPSGHLYSYPGEMTPEDQAKYVEATENDCRLMDTNSSVTWEWFLTWKDAISKYFPRYDANKVCTGFFAVNVPFPLPVFAFKKNELFKVIGDSVVLFKPREWRGTTQVKIPFSKEEYLTPKEMAAALNALPKGSVTVIYLTSDGGAKYQDAVDMVAQLSDHVQMVSHRQVVDFAVKSHNAHH
eukprot:GFYU01005642.1.p1 GENE.GFYU01005642.1~~GFYU01005642.1.p1  ORF type:complete len:616 (-),score=228.54 GFYU01005642.1:1126-2973(-)